MLLVSSAGKCSFITLHALSPPSLCFLACTLFIMHSKAACILNVCPSINTKYVFIVTLLYIYMCMYIEPCNFKILCKKCSCINHLAIFTYKTHRSRLMLQLVYPLNVDTLDMC